MSLLLSRRRSARRGTRASVARAPPKLTTRRPLSDIESTFAELSLQIKALQGVMMSGPALWTTDIGGYFGGNPQDAEFQELIVRWFQFGAFCPLFRLHGHRDGGPPSNECGPTNGDNEAS